MFYRLTDYQYM